MLIFPGAADKKQAASSAVVISARQAVLDEVRIQLETRNLGPVVCHQVNPEQFDTQTIAGEIRYLIFDVESAEHCEQFINKMQFFISKETACIAIGNSDSLLVAGKYQAAGIAYILYHPEQMKMLGKRLDEPVSNQIGNSALKISLLSCKGGTGCSSLSYQLASSLVRQRAISLLLLQGTGGTKNIDLIAKKEISGDVTKLQENLFVLSEQSEHAWDFSLPLYNSYDFVLFDHTIYNVSNVEIEQALRHSHSIVLICNHELAAIRNAKKVIEYNQHLQSSGAGANRLIVCFNHSQPKVGSMIGAEEAANLLGQRVDIVVPFIKSASDPARVLTFDGKHKDVLDNLTNLTLGRSVKAGKGSSLLAALLSRIGRKPD